MRIVLDTNILIRANPKGQGPARELLQKIISGDHVLITSDFLLQEVARVLAYPRIEARWRLHSREVEQYLQVLASLSELVKPHPGISIVSKDIDDDLAERMPYRIQVIKGISGSEIRVEQQLPE